MNFVFINLDDIYSGECDIRPFKIIKSKGVSFHLFNKEVYYDKKENKVKTFDFSDEELSNNVCSIFSEYGNNLYFRGIFKKENFMFEEDVDKHDLLLLVNKYNNRDDYREAYAKKEKSIKKKKVERAEKERIKLIESWVIDNGNIEWEDLEKLLDKYQIEIVSSELEDLRRRVGHLNSDCFLVKGSGVFAFDPTVYYKKVRSILKPNGEY